MLQLSVNAAELADKIGVQRSSISHILSGRNLPSTQFIEKLLNTFPEIEARWLITGHGKPFRTGLNKESEIPDGNEKVMSGKLSGTEKEKTNERAKAEYVPFSGSGSRIEKVLFFYPDRSFTEYIPSK